MTPLSIETLARIISTHYENAKQKAQKIDDLSSHIAQMREELNQLEDSITGIEDPIEDVENLVNELADEMTVDQRMNFKRLVGGCGRGLCGHKLIIN